jgi:hypothetical protein
MIDFRKLDRQALVQDQRNREVELDIQTMQARGKSPNVPEQSTSFSTFLCAQRRVLAIVGLVWAAIYLGGIFAADVHYYYGMLCNDPLLYYLHGWYLLHLHTTAARLADNIPPYHYVGLPGYFRIPLIAASSNFAVQLRLIQITNIAMLFGVGSISSYLLSLGMPPRLKSFSVFCMFSMLLLSTAWEWNVFLPLSDILFSLFFCGAIVAIRSLRDSSKDIRFDLDLGIIMILGLLLPFYAALCWLPKFRYKPIKNLNYILATFGVLIVIAGVFTWRTFLAYGSIWMQRVSMTRWSDWVMNLIAISIPCQVVPSFYYLYSHSLTSTLWWFNWTASARDVFVSITGCGISALVVIGAVRLWNVFRPEICLLLMALPVVMPIASSTTRYLLPFQFLIISCFLAGIRYLFPLQVNMAEKHPRLFIGVMVSFFLVIALLHEIGSKARGSSPSLSLYRDELNISSTYTSLDDYLSGLDVGKSRLVYFPSAQSTSGKWTAIRGLHNYAENFTVYAIFDYPRRSFLPVTEGQDVAMLASLSNWGEFKSELVLDASNQSAFGRIYRITAVRRKDTWK